MSKTYEENVTELEAIVSKLESGNVPLEEMIALYERGEALYRACTETLDAYDKRLEAFAKKEND